MHTRKHAPALLAVLLLAFLLISLLLPASAENTSIPVPDAKTVAYQVGDRFVSFYQTDSAYITLDQNGKAWSQKEHVGAMGGSALYCSAKATNAAGDGFTFTFYAPADGTYYIWGRVFYPNQTANSLFYDLDSGKASNIWDFPDEADAAQPCYNSWQYFYLTERKKGSYTDPKLYGSFTIQNGQWRHAPLAMTLTAGEHSIHFSGREAGMYIDELVVTNYAVNEYDPNACEGNTSFLPTCAFCGTDWKHYCADVAALTGVSAQDHFRNVLHKDATEWTIPEKKPTEPEPPTEPETPTKPETPTEPETPTKPETPTGQELPTDSESVTEGGSAKRGGCASGVCGGGILLIPLLGVLGIRRRKKENS